MVLWWERLVISASDPCGLFELSSGSLKEFNNSIIVNCLMKRSIPRVVVFDNKTRNHILQWPVEEVERLRLNSTEFNGIKLGPGSMVPLDIGTATDQV
ncbi:hypothetical protein L1049_019743 [Liquidambar formosana]|uniref:Uncharacterized protein n=1 Tax=Liquidambar formosana TaxID=63359 RepID=A0AAP0S8Q3_LIQFO